MALVVSLAGLVVSANFWKSNLRINHIIVTGNQIVETNEILQFSHLQRGMGMYDVNLSEVQRGVLSNFFIRDVTIERDLPSTLHINVVERSPLVMVNSHDVVYLDEDGVVLPHSISRAVFDLPILSGISSTVGLKVGGTINDADVREALRIITGAKLVSKELYHSISEIHLRDGGDIILYSTEGGVPIIFGHGNIANKLVRLELFWKEIVRERGSRNLQYVDLRYEDQIVVRWNNEIKKSSS